MGPISDSVLAARAEDALLWDSVVPRDRVRVEVRSGWVTLRGTVDRELERRAAEEDVRRVRGIAGVENLISVTRRGVEAQNGTTRAVRPTLLRMVLEDGGAGSFQKLPCYAPGV